MKKFISFSIGLSIAAIIVSAIDTNWMAVCAWACCLLAEINVVQERKKAEHIHRIANNAIDLYHGRMKAHLADLQKDIDAVLEKETDESLRKWYDNRESAIDQDEKYQVG